MAKVQETDAHLPSSSSLVSNLNCTPENCCAKQVALCVDHILETILGNLKINDLIQTRLISHRFNYFSCRKLESILKFRLEVVVDETKPTEEDRSVVTHSSRRKSSGTMEDFISTLTTANRFPCKMFTLRISNILDERIQRFLSLQGCHIHTVYLLLVKIPPQNILRQLTYFLMEALPNLQNLTLHMEDCYTTRDEFFLEPPNMKWLLPNLKSLSIEGATHQIFALLINAAVNLQTVDNRYSLRYFTKYPGSSRLHLLRDLHLRVFVVEHYLHELELIAGFLATKMEFQIRVLHLELNDCRYVCQDAWPKVSLVMNKILQSVCETVEEMFMQSIRFINDIQVPVFSKVHKLVLENFFSFLGIRCIEEYLPVEFVDFSRMFPILKLIAVHKYVFFEFDLDQGKRWWNSPSFNCDVNLTAWSPAVKSYQDLNGTPSHSLFSLYQFFERNF